MAAYNGERYITAQLQSILLQLSDNDEIVVVDDCSTDSTRDRVRAFQDDNIRLIEHDRNQGILRTFEDAILGASNGIIFLSDQDDLWAPEKVATVLQAFRDSPHATLIATGSLLIRADGSLLSGPVDARCGKFRPGLWANLLHNRYGGNCLAFRASILSDILPLPHNWDVLHDIWIGVRHSLSHGHTLYINRPLTLGRRHENTATGRKPLSMLSKIRIRITLLLALAEFSIRKIIGLTSPKEHHCQKITPRKSAHTISDTCASSATTNARPFWSASGQRGEAVKTANQEVDAE
jgi:glycosyltransferase involved in cell wall biosynthesis